MITIPKLVARHVGAVAGKEAARFVLNHVNLEDRGADGCRVSATDGRALLVVTDSSEGPQAAELGQLAGFDPARNGGAVALVSGADLKDAAKGAADGTVSVLPNESDQSAQVVTRDRKGPAVRTVQTGEGRFPDVDQIVPAKGGEVATITFTTSLLASLLKAMAGMESTDRPYCTFRIHGPDKAVRIDAEGVGGVELLGIIMPVKPAK